MAINWSNPQIISWDFHSVYSWSVFLYEFNLNTVTFSEENPGEWNTDKIVFEIKFINDGNAPSLIINVDQNRLWYVTISVCNVTDIIYWTLDFAQIPFLIDEREYFISFTVTSLSDKRVRLFNYSIFRKWA